MLLEILNEYNSAITLLFSFLITGSTIVYALLTSQLVSETRKMREVQTEPKISVIAQPQEEWIGFIDLIIQNIGLGPAYNIKLKINSDFEQYPGKFLSEIGVMKTGIRYLSPDQKIQLFLTSLTEDHEKKMTTAFEIVAEYQNFVGKTYKEYYTIEFSQFEGFTQAGKPPLYKISEDIEKIQRNISTLTNGSKKIKVISYTEKEIEEQAREFQERAKRRLQEMKEKQ